MIDVTDVANVKVKFDTESIGTGGTSLTGDTNFNATSFTFLRLGDT